MIQTFQNIDDIDKNQWESLLQHSSYRSAFQTPECYDFYSSLSFMETFVTAVCENGVLMGVVVGFVQKDGGKIKQYLSRRAIIYGGPLLADDISDEALSNLLHQTRTLLKNKAIYIETRNFEDYSKFKKQFLHNNFNYHPHYNFHINCSQWNDIENNMGKHRKRYIRLSLKNGATIVENPTLDQVKEYYHILQDLYKTKIKMPLWPFQFFKNLFYSSFGHYFLIEYNGEIIGGSACVVLNNYCVYEWFACGKDGENKNIYPSSITKYAGIKYAYTNGVQRFDMMGAGAPNDGGYGVRDFKAEFGGQLVEHGRFKYICNPFLYNIGKLGVAIIKKIK